MTVKGLERAIQNLNSLSRLIVPEATAKALNRVASRTTFCDRLTVFLEERLNAIGIAGQRF